MNQADAQPLTTSSGKALPRCPTCGERIKGHDVEIYFKVKTLERKHADEKEKRGKNFKSVKMEYGQEPSVSQVNQRAFTPSPIPTPFTSFTPASSKRSAREKGIYLPVSSRPNLTSRYQPILEMRFLLESRGLQLGKFPITQGGEWAFTVTGSKAQVIDWATETKTYAGARITPRNRLQSALFLVIGVVSDVIIMLSVYV